MSVSRDVLKLWTTLDVFVSGSFSVYYCKINFAGSPAPAFRCLQKLSKHIIFIVIINLSKNKQTFTQTHTHENSFTTLSHLK